MSMPGAPREYLRTAIGAGNARIDPSVCWEMDMIADVSMRMSAAIRHNIAPERQAKESQVPRTQVPRTDGYQENRTPTFRAWLSVPPPTAPS